MISTVLSSVYILAGISIRNTRQLFTVLVGEAAILAADGGLEQGLWTYIRDFPDDQGDCDQTPAEYQSEPLDVSISDVTLNHCRSLLMPNPATLTLTDENPEKEIYVVDQGDPSGPPGYGEVSFTWVSGSGTYTVCDWDVPVCSAEPPDGSLSGAGSPESVTLNPAEKYVVVLEADAGGFGVSVYAEDGTGSPKGLPSDLITIYGLGKDPFVTRQLEVQISP